MLEVILWFRQIVMLRLNRFLRLMQVDEVLTVGLIVFSWFELDSRQV